MNDKKNIEGFTLVECIIAMVITVVGFAAILSLLTVCVRMEVVAREMSVANSSARLKMEELKATTRVVGGSLSTNTPNYFDNPTPNYTRRWQITNGVLGSQTVVVLMTPTNTGQTLPEVSLFTRMQ